MQHIFSGSYLIILVCLLSGCQDQTFTTVNKAALTACTQELKSYLSNNDQISEVRFSTFDFGGHNWQAIGLFKTTTKLEGDFDCAGVWQDGRVVIKVFLGPPVPPPD